MKSNACDTYPGGTKKYAKPPTREVAGRPIAPTRRRFITLRLPMSGTSPETAAATVSRATFLGATVALRPRPRTLHPSFAEEICTEAEVARAAILTHEGYPTVCVREWRGVHAIPGGSTNESRVANRFFLAKNSTKNAFVIGQSVYLLCPFIDGLIAQERGQRGRGV